MHGRGIVEAGRVRKVRRGRGVKVGLPQDDVRQSYTGGAKRVLWQQLVGFRDEARDIVIDQDAVVDRPRTEAVAIGHEEAVAHIGHALGGPEHFAAGDRILTREAGLADDQPCAVVVHPLRSVLADPNRNRLLLPQHARGRQDRSACQRYQDRQLESLRCHLGPCQTAFTSPPSIIRDEPVT